MQWRDTHPFPKCHRWRSCWVSWERLKHDCSPAVPCRHFAGLAGDTIEWFLTGGTAVSAGVCSTAGQTGSIFHLALFAWLVLFQKCESKTKAKQLGSFWWAGDRRGFGFLTGPLGHSAVSGNHSWRSEKWHLCGFTDIQVNWFSVLFNATELPKKMSENPTWCAQKGLGPFLYADKICLYISWILFSPCSILVTKAAEILITFLRNHVLTPTSGLFGWLLEAGNISAVLGLSRYLTTKWRRAPALAVPCRHHMSSSLPPAVPTQEQCPHLPAGPALGLILER